MGQLGSREICAQNQVLADAKYWWQHRSRGNFAQQDSPLHSAQWREHIKRFCGLWNVMAWVDEVGGLEYDQVRNDEIMRR